MLLLSEWGWISLACTFGLWGGIGCLGWEFKSVSKIRYWTGWFSAAGYTSNVKAFRGGMGSVLGHLLADMALAEHSHARGCIPASFKVLSVSIGIFEGLYWSTRSVEGANSNSDSNVVDMVASAGKFIQVEFRWRLLQ